MERLQKEQEEARQQAEVEEWREQHQAARDAARRVLGWGIPEGRCQERQASSGGAKRTCQSTADGTRWRPTSLHGSPPASCSSSDTQQQAALLAVGLVVSLQLEVQ